MVRFRRLVGQHAQPRVWRDAPGQVFGAGASRHLFDAKEGAQLVLSVRCVRDFWERYRDAIPEGERNDFMSAYYKRLTSDDEQTRLDAARAWAVWEGSTSKLYPDADLMDHWEGAHEALSLARIECHYFMNNSFFPSENYLIDNVDKIRNIPTVIVQGRYDVVCPMTSAWDLHRALPEAEFIVVPDSGHSVSEKGTTSALVDAMDRFKTAGRSPQGVSG